MTTAADSFYFRRRTMGRAASPPTWACYEQIPHDNGDYSDSGSDSCSEDEDDYSKAVDGHEHASDSEDSNRDETAHQALGSDDIDMDIDDEELDGDCEKKALGAQKDVKGKQRAIEPEPKTKRHHHKRRPVYTLRPILTIQKSQGFVWNQDLFVPPYIKDRYVASTSPPNSKGFISTSVSSTNSGLTDYEVEVVEIRVQEGELRDIIP